MKLLLFILIFSLLSADTVSNLALFGRVVNVADDDVLNIRASANYRSRKVGYLPNGALIKVYKCKKVGKSTWCKVGHLRENNYKGYKDNSPNGWVNAKYLKFSNKGYIVDDNLNSNYNLEAKELAKSLASWIKRGNVDKIVRHIHPTRGVLLTHNINFSTINKHFDKSSFKLFYNSNKRLYWGESYAKGDKIYLSLKEYLKKLVRDSKKITKVVKVDPKEFYFPNAKGVIAYEVKWINKYSNTKEYDWLGLVVIVQKYRGKYYIIGVLYNRWTI